MNIIVNFIIILTDPLIMIDADLARMFVEAVTNC